jgi:SAM-dependent methyltransferase
VNAIRRSDECPACGHKNWRAVAVSSPLVRRRFVAFSEKKYGGLMNTWLNELDLAVVKCHACAHHWYREHPDEASLARLYEASRPLVQQRSDRRNTYTRLMRAEMRRLRRLVISRSRNHKPAFLDYGAGFGKWVRAASDVGFVVTAYEPSEKRAGELSITQHSQLDGRLFDAVNLEQVLEHVPEPLGLLQTIRRLCYPHTIVRITVPNIDRPYEGSAVWRDWPFNGRRPHTMAPFEHLHGFTPDSLALIVRRAGFESIPRHELWRSHPVDAIRSLVGRFLPAMRQTKLLICPSSHQTRRQPKDGLVDEQLSPAGQ